MSRDELCCEAGHENWKGLRPQLSNILLRYSLGQARTVWPSNQLFLDRLLAIRHRSVHGMLKRKQ